MLGADPLPETAEELTAWIGTHEQLGPSPGSEAAIRFLRRPPLPWTVRAAYGFLFRAAAATVPVRIRQILGLHGLRVDVDAGRAVVMALRQALRASPDWQLALIRTGAAPPPGVRFRRANHSPTSELEQLRSDARARSGELS
jgi:ER-bound oxygenase mpaB/B'/Rubber oxygenase, catalytic domain